MNPDFLLQVVRDYLTFAPQQVNAVHIFWLIWCSTKRANVIMICPSCIVVSVVGIGVVGVFVSLVSICAQPS